MSTQPGVLYVVATPIGNLCDLSPRAAEVLRRVALVLAEDTRVTRKLLAHYGIGTPLASCREHNERQVTARALARLAGGESLALVSDAGTPLISDPGRYLVGAAHEAGVPVRAVPGPSAVTAALSVCGLPADRFLFEGFLPPRPAQRRAALAALATEPRTLVFLEAPHRIAAMLADVAAAFGAARRLCVARELTKLHECVIVGGAGEAAVRAAGDRDARRGEIVVVVEGAAQAPPAERAEIERVLEVLLARLPLGEAVQATAAITGARRNEVYALALERG